MAAAIWRGPREWPLVPKSYASTTTKNTKTLHHITFTSTKGVVVLRGTTKDAERASKARSKHSTHSGHSMIKPVANSAAYNFWLSYNANNSPKTRAFVKRDCASKIGKAKIANPALLACVSVGVVLHAQKPGCRLEHTTDTQSTNPKQQRPCKHSQTRSGWVGTMC